MRLFTRISCTPFFLFASVFNSCSIAQKPAQERVIVQVAQAVKNWRLSNSSMGPSGATGEFRLANQTIFAVVEENGHFMVERSTDEGSTWKDTKTKVPGDLADLVFDQHENGYSIVNRGSDGDASSQVLVTNDSGLTWSQAFPPLDGNLTKIIMASDGRSVFAVGAARYDDNRGLPDVRGLAVLRDAAGTWKDVSPSINAVLKKANGRFEDQLVSAAFIDQGDLVALSLRGSILTSSDNGTLWRNTLSIQSEAEVGQRLITTNDGKRFWILGGSMAVEGMRATISLWDRSSIVTMVLPKYYLEDLKETSAGSLVASGRYLDGHTQYGVILLSSDEGKKWEQIYQGNSEQVFTDLLKIDKNQILVADNSGSLLHIIAP